MKHKILLLAILFVMGKLSAQTDLQKVIPLSPNAAAIAKYGETPVSYYTGVPNVSIPLYTIHGRELQLSLGLSYHAGGNKVETVASWVGLGWSLNTIPSISRSVNGLADEGVGGYLHTYNGKTVKELYDGKDGTTTQQTDFSNFLRAVENGEADSEPDVYYYTLLGKSGKFYYNLQSQKYITYPYENIKITFNASINSFTIISDDGTSYLFDVPEVSTTSGTTSYNPVINTTTWWASKISNSNQTDEISFVYGTENQYFLSSNSVTRHVLIGTNNNCNGQEPNLNYTNNITQTWYNAKPLTKIIFNSGSVEFNRLAAERNDLQGGYALENIKVFDKNQQVVKQVNFVYQYLNSSTAGSGCTGLDSRETKWLFLNEVKDKGKDGVELKHWFEYDMSNVPPCRTSPAQDFWGYYNGKISNQDLMPSTFIDFPSSTSPTRLPGADRYVDEDYTQFGILKKVHYPTGGFSEFLFENNEANNPTLPLEYVLEAAGIESEETITTNYYQTAFQINNISDEFLNNNNPNGGAFVNISAGNFGCDLSGGSNACAYVRVKGTSSNNSTLLIPITGNSTNVYLPNGSYLIEATFNQSPPQYQGFYTVINWSKVNPASSETNRLAGGLRIKEIKTHDGVSTINDVIQRFRYVAGLNSTTSSGDVLGTQFFNYKDFVQQNFIWNHPQSNTLYTCINDFIRVTSFSNVQAISHSGSFVGYSTVLKVSSNTSATGISEYKFRNSPDIVDPSYPHAPSESNEHLRGQPAESTEYRKVGTTYLPVTKVVYDYVDNLVTGSSFGLKIANPIIFGNNTGINVSKPLPEYRSYEFTSSLLLLTQKTDYIHDPNDQSKFVKTITELTYNPQHLQLITSKFTNSKSEQIETKFFYPQDLTLTGTAEEARLLLVSRNNISTVLKQEKYKNTNSLLERVTTQYKKFNSNNIVKPYEISQKFETNSEIPKVRFTAYSEEGNILEQSKVDDISKSYYWGYNDQYPIAEAVNAKGREIYYAPFEEQAGWTGTQWQYGDVAIAYDGSKNITGRSAAKIEKSTAGEKYCHADYWLQIDNAVSTKYKVSGWVYSTGPTVDIYLFMKNGTGTGYYTQFDYLTTNVTNQWVYVEKVFDVPETIKKLNIRLDNNGGGTVWFDDIRVHPASSMMTTYTYDPLVGMTSQTDVNNRRTHYTYDHFNRLSLVLDHDKNILKKYCYNYQGQQEDCSLGCTTTAANWQNTTTAIRCKLNSNNQSTGEQEREQRDLNTCSPTYNQTRWVVIGTNTTACPLPVQTVYAKVFYENPTYSGYVNYADVVVRFYSDASCTQPLSVSNLSVYFRESGYSSYGYYDYYGSATANGNYLILEFSAEISDFSGYEEYYKNYYLEPGNYNVVY